MAPRQTPRKPSPIRAIYAREEELPAIEELRLDEARGDNLQHNVINWPEGEDVLGLIRMPGGWWREIPAQPGDDPLVTNYEWVPEPGHEPPRLPPLRRSPSPPPARMNRRRRM